MNAPTPITARELLATRFQEPKWAIPGLLPEGLFVIAARAKIGKSWMMLGWSIAVAAGGRALGTIPVEPGDVLYLALEDTLRRLQTRLVTMLEDEAQAPERLDVQTSWPRLDQGGLEAIGAWLEAHPEARLVVIDTLAKVRAPSSRRDGNRYDEDYDALGGLKRLADAHGVAIGVVHHTRKAGAEDVLDTVSGTTGLTAGPDTILVLTRARNEPGAVLHITGRDVEETEHLLRFDAGIGHWSMVSSEVVDVSSERRKILDALLNHKSSMRPSEMAAWVQRTPGATRKLMWEMAQAGQLSGNGVGGYYLPVTVVTGNSGNGGNGSNGHA